MDPFHAGTHRAKESELTIRKPLMLSVGKARQSNQAERGKWKLSSINLDKEAYAYFFPPYPPSFGGLAGGQHALDF